MAFPIVRLLSGFLLVFAAANLLFAQIEKRPDPNRLKNAKKVYHLNSKSTVPVGAKRTTEKARQLPKSQMNPAGMVRSKWKLSASDGKSLPATDIYRPPGKRTNLKRPTVLNTCDTIVLTRQSQIDSFSIYYPTCTRIKHLEIRGENASPAITSLAALLPIRFIENDLHITNTNLTSLNGLQNIDTIGYYLWMGDNPNLTNLNDVHPIHLGGFVLFGMPQLANIDGLFSRLITTSLWSCFFDRLAVPNFNAFSRIKSVFNFGVSNCPNITSLAGFENLTAAPFGMGFSSNPLLTDVSQLSGITQTNYLNIYYNDALTDLTGLHNLHTLQGVVRIVGNGALTNLTPFDDDLVMLNNVEPNQQVEIIFNQQLSVCNEPFLCAYLSNAGAAEIRDNLPGCESIEQVAAACGITLGCSEADISIWQGSASDEWDSPDNWQNNKVPGPCTRVYIPENTDNSPRLLNSVRIGGLYMINSSLYTDGFDVSIINKLQLNGAGIEGYGTITASFIDSPGVYNSNIAGRFICRGYFGRAEFLNNYFDGDVDLSDSTGRQDGSAAFFNTVLGNLTMVNNSNYGQFYLSNASPFSDFITGHLHVINRSDADISVGLGGGQPLRIGGNATFETTGAGKIDINNLGFDNPSTDSRLYNIGSHPLEINNLYVNKGFLRKLYLEANVKVKTSLNMAGFGTSIATGYPGKLLTLGDNCTAQLNYNQQFIEGPVQKEGDDAFDFPLGSYQGSTFKTAPLSITAPQNADDAYMAEYLKRNPATDGFDTSRREAGLVEISGKEYWTLMRTNGSSEVKAKLTYDSSRSGIFYDLPATKIVRWEGTQWVSLENGAYNGNLVSGSIESERSISEGGPITFATYRVRKPMITIGAMDTLLCAGQSFRVPIHLDTLMIQNNVFTVQLSDSNGNFSGFIPTLGTKAGIDSDTITAFAPNVFAVGKTYRIQVIGSLPSDTSINTIAVKFIRVPDKPFAVIGPDTLCLGSGPVAYYPDAKDSGTFFDVIITPSGNALERKGDTAVINWTNAGQYNLRFVARNFCGSGYSITKQIVVRPPAPGAAPLLGKTGRWLEASAAPSPQVVSGYLWLRNGLPIEAATSKRYYAAQAGTYTVAYANACGVGPASNSISFAANSLPQTISFATPDNKTFGDAPFSINASSSSGLPLQLQIANGPGNLTAGVYSITHSGTVRIIATQPGDDLYDTAAPVERTFTINKAAQTISFPPLAAAVFPHSPGFVPLGATASSGLPLSFQLNSGLAAVNGAFVLIYGAGLISITARLPGDTNYLPAEPVTQSFCVRVPELSTISGAPFVCPGQTVTYSINQLPGLTYHWRLSNGTSYAATGNTVDITWNTPGTYTLLVNAEANCGAPTATDSLVVQVIAPVTPGAPTNLLPANASNDLSLPLQLSWAAGANSLTYDLYVWDLGNTRPAEPHVAHLGSISYQLPVGSLAFNKSYQWQVVSRNACLQTESIVQSFRLRPLPDLTVTQVQVPATANSGETMRIQWTIKNIGPGNTSTNQNWTDAVFLSFDSTPAFVRPPQVQAANWNQGEFPLRPLLVGSLPNVRALDSGQQYSNFIDFTIPINFSGPYYVYVISNYPSGPSAPLQMTLANDSLRAPMPVQVLPTPTPDLQVESVTVPATTFSGSTISVNYRIKNAGALMAANARWTDRIYISPSPLFNRNNAILLKKPKPNGSYYPNAQEAVFDTSRQLAGNESINLQADVVVPNFIQGTWFVHVETNATQTIYEGPLANNNINNSNVQILLTPTPAFVVSSLNVPFRQAGTTQPLSISYQLTNTGFADQTERNKGHYYVPVVCSNNSNGFRDSLGYGSSSWEDQVYLSTNPTGLNTATAVHLGTLRHGDQGSGLFVADNPFDTLCNTNLEPNGVNIQNVLRPRSVHPQNFSFRIPQRLPEGTYYLYVLANSGREVFTFPDTPVVSRSQPIVVQRPDVAISNFVVPANSIGDSGITIRYSVRNNGSTIFSTARRDLLYVSQQPTLDNSAQLVGINEPLTTLATGAESNHSFHHRFAAGTTGLRYFHLVVNFDSVFAETDYSNNQSSAGTTVTLPIGANLQVSELQLADTIQVGSSNRIRYRISNVGSAPINATWIDSVFISCQPAFNRSSASFVIARQQQRQMTPGTSLLDSFTFAPIPGFLYSTCFPKANVNTAYFHVVTNANAAVFEGNNSADNFTGSGPMVLQNNAVDHVVMQVLAADSAIVGRSYSVQWAVQNKGRRPIVSSNGYDYTAWFDGVYFSEDSILDENDHLAKARFQATPLDAESTYTSQLTLPIPKLPTGFYYVHVVSDIYSSITAELVRSNNSNLIRNADGTARKVYIEQLPLPDLTVHAEPPTTSTVAIGQPVGLPYRVQNQGTGATFPNSWTDQLWLSTDFVPNNGNDVLLWTKNRSSGLAAGQHYNDSAFGTLPNGIAPGNYLLLMHTDASNQIIENTDTNNVAATPITVFLPPSSDLIVQHITHADTAWLGEIFTGLRWSIRNQSANSARGQVTDGVYLSNTSRTDSTAVLQAALQRQLNLAPLAAETAGIDFRPTGVVEGVYQMLVQTDLQNNLPETNKTNNIGNSGKPLQVMVRPLVLNETTNTTLQQWERYYKLHIPDSLIGATIMVSLSTPDSLTQKNELYAAASYIPSAARYDARFERPNSGNQFLIIPSANNGSYYVMVRSATPNPPPQNISLRAVKLPFAILTVQNNSGGNGGNVTVKISGSLFVNGMTARLTRQSTVIEASRVQFVHGGLLYATFPLQGRPLGIYTVSLHKSDGSVAELVSGFSIVPPNTGGLITGGGANTGPTRPGTEPGCDPGADAGLNSQLVTELVYPSKVFNGQLFTIQVNFINPTNMDIPAPTRVLNNDLKVPVSTTVAGLAQENSTIALRLQEADGPPGIIRAGGNGTILLYARAPTLRGIAFVTFTIQ